MNKAELVKAVAAKNDGVTLKLVNKVVNDVFATITDTLSDQNEDVNIAGFGKFVVREHAQRKGCHPKTGEVLVISARKLPKFKAFKAFKVAVDVPF